MADTDAAQTEGDIDNDLDQGFAEETTAPKAAAESQAPAPDLQKADPPPPKDGPAKVDPPAVEHVQLTKADYEKLMGLATSSADTQKKLDRLFGTTGELSQVVKKLQTDTPQGVQIELPADVVAEMEQDFPELAGHLKTALEKTINGIKGTGAGSKAEFDPDALSVAAKKIVVDMQLEALDDAHPNWREIVGAAESFDKHDPENPFRKWLGTQPQEYQDRVNNSDSAVVISRAIDKFNAAQKAQQPKPAPQPQPSPKTLARKDRISGAVQPKGDGGRPPPARTTDDDFEQGFAEG